jgi:hypothetical protein
VIARPKIIAVMAMLVFSALPGYSSVIEVLGVPRHLSRKELLAHFADSGIKRLSPKNSLPIQKMARTIFVELTKERLKSTDSSLKIDPESWPVEVFVFEQAPSRTKGVLLLLLGYCGDRQVFVMPFLAKNIVTWESIVKILDSKYERIEVAPDSGQWTQTSVLSLGKPLRVIYALKSEDKPDVSAMVVYLDALNIMNYQVERSKTAKEKARDF